MAEKPKCWDKRDMTQNTDTDGARGRSRGKEKEKKKKKKKGNGAMSLRSLLKRETEKLQGDISSV